MESPSAAFADFGLSPETLNILRSKGFEQPTPIQCLTIPALLENRCDLIAQAQTGTGKTAAFAIPIIEALLNSPASPAPRALILAPTRELAMQIAVETESLCGNRPLRCGVFYGGQPIEIQLARLKNGVDIAIGTPGRVIDLMERKVLRLERLRFAVLDEADEMLNMGFVEDIERILDATPQDKRMLMFSATVPAPIREIANRFMHDAEYVSTRPVAREEHLTEQIAYEVRCEDKLKALERILDAADDPYAMVFCRTRVDVDELTVKLQNRGLPVESLHGELAQSQRTRIIGRFRNKLFKILIATDVAARGIDVNDLTHVINYSLPQSSDIYTHRIGRTGRAGKKGTAVTLYTPGEYRKLIQIRRATGNDIAVRPLPDGPAVVAAKKTRFRALLAEREQPHPVYLEFVEELAHSGIAPELLAAQLLAMRFARELDTESYPDLSNSAERRRNAETVRLYLGVGKAEGYGVGRILDMLYQEARVWKSKVGRIECKDHFSYVELPEDAAQAVLRQFADSRLKVEIARPAEAEDGASEAAPERPTPAKRIRRSPVAERAIRNREAARRGGAKPTLRQWAAEFEQEAATVPKAPKRRKSDGDAVPESVPDRGRKRRPRQ